MRVYGRGLIFAFFMLALSVAVSQAQTTIKRAKNERIIPISTCTAPSVDLAASSNVITLPANCAAGEFSSCASDASPQIQLTANANDPTPSSLNYKYTTTGGHIVGSGATVTWDLTGVTPGNYTTTVEVDNSCGCVAFVSNTVVVRGCNCTPMPCANISVTGTDNILEGSPATFTANLSGGSSANAAYEWTVTGGTIIGGQGTNMITVDTKGTGGQPITATVNVSGLPPSCGHTASYTITPGVPLKAKKFDEYPDVNFNDEKARLDNFAIQLQGEPGAVGYIIAYGSKAGPSGGVRADRAKEYLVNSRGIDATRVVILDGGCRNDLDVELWIVPTGAAPPHADTAYNVPCGSGKATGAKRGSRRRR